MDQSHLTPKIGQPHLNNLLQHSVVKPCPYVGKSGDKEWLSGKRITAMDKRTKNLQKLHCNKL